MVRDTVWRAMWLALGLGGCTANIADVPAWTANGTPPPGAPGAAAAGSGTPGAVGRGQAAGGSGAPAANGGPVAPGSCDSLRLSARAVMVVPRQYVNVLKDLIGPTAVSDQDAAASSEFAFDTV